MGSILSCKNEQEIKESIVKEPIVKEPIKNTRPYYDDSPCDTICWKCVLIDYWSNNILF